jgi:hypothetical protein
MYPEPVAMTTISIEEIQRELRGYREAAFAAPRPVRPDADLSGDAQ